MQFTVQQADTLASYFENLKGALRQRPRIERAFSDLFTETYSIPGDRIGWQRLMAVKADHSANIDYEKRLTAAMLKMIDELDAFVKNHKDELRFHFRDLGYLNTTEVQHALSALVTDRIPQLRKIEQDAATVEQFGRELITGFNMLGFAAFKDISYGDNHLTRRKQKNLELQGEMKIGPNGLDFRVWHIPTQGSSVRKHVDIEQGQTADQVRAIAEAAWAEVVGAVEAKVSVNDQALVELRLKDRELTGDEVELLGSILAVSNMGHGAKYTVEDGHLVTKDSYGTRKTSLANLKSCAAQIIGSVNYLFEEQDAADAVDEEIKSWKKDLSGKSGETYTLAKVAKIWNDLLPICAWLADHKQ